MFKSPFLVCIFLVTTFISFAKAPITDGETSPVLLDLDPYMIKALRGNAKEHKVVTPGKYGNDGSIIDLLKEKPFQQLINKHDLKLFNGPMLGGVTESSAKVWFRTAGAAKVQVLVNTLESDVIKTEAKNDFTGIASIRGLKPFQKYQYRLLIDGKEFVDPSFNFTTYPNQNSKSKFDIAFGACSRYVPHNEPIWQKIIETNPIAYLGLGDNLYIDATERRDTQRLHYYRRMLRTEYRNFISQTSMYAVWDDHDFGMNDSAGGEQSADWKNKNLEVFQQNWLNPHYGSPHQNDGVWHNFTVGDVEVFMTDGRFNRTEKGEGPGTMLGAAQKQWLMDGLKNSKAKFKVIGSGTMWTNKADKGGKDSWSGKQFRAERDEIFDVIKQHKINGVILLAGDRHRTEIWENDIGGAYPLYEFLSGKVTNLHTHHTRKQALWSHNEGNFWGNLNFDFSKDDPTVTFSAINQDGKILKMFPLKLSELSF
jgi:alkaline phosphatase D